MLGDLGERLFLIPIRANHHKIISVKMQGKTIHSMQEKALYVCKIIGLIKSNQGRIY